MKKIVTMFNLIKNKKTRQFLKKHWKLILVIIYVISPIDLIPDVLMPLGYTEDILLVLTTLLDYYIRRKNDSAFDFDKKQEPVDAETED